MVADHYENISRKCNHFVALNLPALSRGSHPRLFSARLREDIHSGGEPLYHTLTSASLHGLSLERLDEVVKQAVPMRVL
jgi:hypothetical protein